MKRMLPLFLLAVLPALADIITASLNQPGSTPGTVVVVQPTGTGNDNFFGTGYSVEFTDVAPDQGVVRGALGSHYAIPVAGQIDGVDAYLTDGYGSSLTTDAARSGNYFSTGAPGTIDIYFTELQRSLALLWGSIDYQNSLSLTLSGNNESRTLTGTTIQGLTAGFAGNGSQTYRGSAWVVITPDFEFQHVTASSGVVSFEFAGLAASTENFSVPEPSAALLFVVMICGVLLALMGAGARKRFA